MEGRRPPMEVEEEGCNTSNRETQWPGKGREKSEGVKRRILHSVAWRLAVEHTSVLDTELCALNWLHGDGVRLIKSLTVLF